jgi:hypothetical protein
MAQRCPFQCSASVSLPWLVAADPTAVHAMADGQDTAVSAMAFAPAGRRRCWSDQVRPSQRSARPWAGVALPPTAVQAVAEEQDTPVSGGLVDLPLIAWMCQLVPFQRSASGVALMSSPTAVHLSAAGHSRRRHGRGRDGRGSRHHQRYRHGPPAQTMP